MGSEVKSVGGSVCGGAKSSRDGKCVEGSECNTGWDKPDELGGRVPGTDADKGGMGGCSTMVAMEGGNEDGVVKVNEGEMFK